MLWHFCLGCPNFMYLKSCFHHCSSIKVQNISVEKSVSWQNIHEAITPSLSYTPCQHFFMVHIDVWGPSTVNSITKAHWFVSFVDDPTTLTWVFLMKEKSKVGQIFQNLNSMIQIQFPTKFKVLKTDMPKSTSSLLWVATS